MAMMKLKTVLIACGFLSSLPFIIAGCSPCLTKDCDNGVFCDGEEFCVVYEDEAICISGAPIECPEGQICNEITGCEDIAESECSTDEDCDEVQICNEDTGSCEEKLTISNVVAGIPAMNTYRVYGEAKNTSGEQLSYAEIEVRMLDGNGVPFHTERVSIDGLNPDEVWDFEVIYEGDLPDVQSYEWSVIAAH